MPLTQDEQDAITAKRRAAINYTHFYQVLDAYCDPETGAGYVIFESAIGKRGPEAALFRPRTHRKSFRDIPVGSSHARIGLPARLRQILDDEKARKVAAHDLAVGDIIAEHWGVTIKDVNFFRVTDIPHPRKVTLCPIPQVRVDGDFMGGTVTANTSHPGDASRAATYRVSMLSGEAEVQTGSRIGRATKWDGNPVFTHAAD